MDVISTFCAFSLFFDKTAHYTYYNYTILCANNAIDISDKFCGVIYSNVHKAHRIIVKKHNSHTVQYGFSSRKKRLGQPCSALHSRWFSVAARVSFCANLTYPALFCAGFRDFEKLRADLPRKHADPVPLAKDVAAPGDGRREPPDGRELYPLSGKR